MTVNQNKALKAVLLLVAVALLVWLVTLVAFRQSTPKITTTTPQTTVPAPEQRQAAVSVTGSGFMPQTVTVRKGTAVVWTNATKSPHQVAADPYPDKSSLPQLSSKVFGPSETYSFTFDKTGTYHYHDQLHPTTSGTVVVVD